MPFVLRGAVLTTPMCVVQAIADNDDSTTGGSPGSWQGKVLPNPIPPSLLLQLLSSGQLQPPASPPLAVPPQQQPPTADSNDDNNDGQEVAKRFLCNMFTGCGGRYRRRHASKRLIPGLLKRPFCNNFGCFNSKRGLLSPAGAGQAARAGQELGRDVPGAGLEEEQGKRDKVGVTGLFCNGYGGCRGGKRSLFSPWMSKMSSVAEGRR